MDSSSIEPLEEAMRETVSEAVNETVNETVRKHLVGILNLIYQEKSLSGPGIESKLTMTRPTAKRILALLKAADLVVFSGAPKTGTYILTEKTKQLIKDKVSKLLT